MNKNGIKFKLPITEDKIFEIEGEIIDDKIYRMNKPVLCNCTGTSDLDKAPQFIYENGEVVCPVCGKKSLETYTFEDYEVDELENIHLTYFGIDYLTLQKLYKLTYSLPYEKWITVSHLFMKLKPEMVDMGDFEPHFVGWVTSNPEEVEDLLGIKPELRIKNLEEKEQKEEEFKNIVDELLEEFSVLETPDLVNGKDKIKLDGEEVQNPFNPLNEYGTGEYFVICKDSIWYVRQNAREGDKWDLNNVYIKGSAGGIGKKAPYSDELADKIRRLV